MSRNWTREELADALARNPGLRLAEQPLMRAPRENIKIHHFTSPPTVENATNSPARSPTISPKPSVEKPSNGIHELMATPAYQGSLQPEESLSVAVATELRRLTHQGRLRAVWSRLPLEHPEGGRYGMVAQCKRAAMGGVAGAPDFWFIWNGGGGLIELKVEGAQASLLTPSGKAGLRRGRRTYLRGRQRLFQAWAEMFHVKHAVCRSVPEVLTVLQQWGVLE